MGAKTVNGPSPVSMSTSPAVSNAAASVVGSASCGHRRRRRWRAVQRFLSRGGLYQAQLRKRRAPQPGRPLQVQLPRRRAPRPGRPLQAQLPRQRAPQPGRPLQAQLPQRRAPRPGRPLRARLPRRQAPQPGQPLQARLPRRRSSSTGATSAGAASSAAGSSTGQPLRCGFLGGRLFDRGGLCGRGFFGCSFCGYRFLNSRAASKGVSKSNGSR